jgi:hypothetical protein
MKKAFKIVFVLIVGVALLIGCAKKGIYPEFFQGRYPNFKAGPEGGADFVFIKNDVDFKKYKMVNLDIMFYFASAGHYNAIHPDVVSDLRDALHMAIADALGDAYPIVDKPRHDALRIRVAITGVVPLVLATTEKYAQTGVGEEDIAGKYASVGGASMQAEILDSWTGKRVGAVIDTKGGDKDKEGANMDEWKHTKEAFKFWAQRLRNWLDQTHNME